MTWKVDELATDNRDPNTTWIWIDHGARYFEVFPWELVQNAIENAHVDVREELLFQAGNVQGPAEERLWDLCDQEIKMRMEAYYPEFAAEMQGDQEPSEDAQRAWNECTSYIIGAIYFHFARCAFDSEYRHHHQSWRE